mmetsp:Transcript_23780/g.68332  ORF Transcript_23780/g.68332 Transcript_23780/m.68332 type:complete len:356 (-) Transcript_23780:1258-2325(-)
MSTTFDKYEEQFVALVAKAGCSLAQVSSHHAPSPKASTTTDGSPTTGGDGPEEQDDTGTSTDAALMMTDMEHVQVASMLLGQASDHLDAMEVEWRLVAKALGRSSRATRKSGQAVASELRHRLDGCSDMCTALRSECRAVRARLRDADRVNEATEEVRFEEQQTESGGDTSRTANNNGSANANASSSRGASKKAKKVKQWTCDACKVAKFADYDEACRHEETCDGKAKAPPPDEDELSYKQQSKTRSSTVASSNGNRGGGTTPKGRSSAANAYRSALFEKAERSNATLASQNATLDHARRVMADTEGTAGTITEELARNREAIESAQGRVGELHGMTNSARRTIKTMQRRKKYLF